MQTHRLMGVIYEALCLLRRNMALIETADEVKIEILLVLN
jgi:hypothetical protein